MSKRRQKIFWLHLVSLLPMLSICFISRLSYREVFPFEVKIPSARPVDISALSEVEFNEELEKGYADMQAGRTKNAKKAFSDIRKDYGL